jgi:hypothetical protein
MPRALADAANGSAVIHARWRVVRAGPGGRSASGERESDGRDERDKQRGLAAGHGGPPGSGARDNHKTRPEGRLSARSVNPHFRNRDRPGWKPALACPVLVLAHLSTEFLLPFRLALSHEDRLILATCAMELPSLVAQHVPDVLVVSPQRDADTGASPLVRVATCFPYLPIVVYASPTPEAMHATFDLARYGVRHIIFRGHDDAPRRIRMALDRVRGEALCERVWHGIRPRFAGAPLPVASAMERLFHSPLQFRGVESIARSSARSRRSLDDWLARLDLASARLFWIAARVAWAYPAMKTPGYLLKRITKRMGYARPQLFADQVRRLTGLNPTALRDSTDPDALVTWLVARLGRRDADDEAPPGGWPRRRARRSRSAESGRE